MTLITTEQIKQTNTFTSLPIETKKRFLKKKGCRTVKSAMNTIKIIGFDDWNYKSETSLLVKKIIKELINK